MGFESVSVKSDTAQKLRELRDRRDSTLDGVVSDLLDESDTEV
jgi:hypothetical protein